MPWLRNYYRYARQLDFDPETGSATEHDAATMDPADTTPRPGAWVELRDGTEARRYGLSPSASGPVFFAGERVFPLPADGFAVSLEVGEGGAPNRFALTIDDARVVDVTYRPDPLETFDAVTGDSDEFFEWVTEVVRVPHFRRLFTLPG